MGLVHGLAHPIGFKYQVPHGKICAMLLPRVIEYNLELRIPKYANLCHILSENGDKIFDPTLSDEENARQLITLISNFFTKLDIPCSLKDVGVAEEDFDWIIENTKGGSVNANIRVPDPESLKDLLDRAY